MKKCMYDKVLLEGIENFEDKLRDYAQLILNKGIYFQKGWALALECPTVAPELARMLIEEAYKYGASDVQICHWDPYIARAKYKNSEMQYLGHEWDWPLAARKKYGDQLAFVIIESYNSEFYDGLSTDRILQYNKVIADTFSSFKQGLKTPYTICTAASREWAQIVYPDLPIDEAYVALWNIIFDIMRIDGKGNAIKNWKAHSDSLVKNRDFLNEHHFKKLKVTTGLGTDVEIGLPKKHLWVASPKNISSEGLPFAANMPTEEIFCIPEKTSVNGTIVASRPMICKSGIVRDARYELKDGKIVKFSATEGEDVLRKIMDNNENGHYLGEIAIVPYDTSISKSGLTFYNNMFDENAGCHIAVGNAYSKCLVGGLKMTNEELEAEGINVCAFHDDCVFGTPDTKIIGITETSEEITIFEHGAWTI